MVLIKINLLKVVAYLLMETVSRAKVLAVEATVVEVMVVDEGRNSTVALAQCTCMSKE